MLNQSQFIEMFGDPVDNPMGWPIRKLSDVAKVDGTMTKEYEKYADYPHIGIDSIEKNTGILSGYRTVQEDNVISPKYYFGPQHILYSKIRPVLNKVALPDFEGLCSADCYPLLVTGMCDRKFLAHVMRSDYFLDYVLSYSGRSQMPKVNRKQLEGFSFPCPPIELQKKFTVLIDQSDKSKFTGFKSQFIEMFYDKGYPVKTIGDVIDRKISRVAKVFDKTDEIQYLDISSIDNSSKTVTGLTPYVLKDAPSRAQYILKQGDIMYSTVRPNLQNVAINPYSEGNVVGSTGFCVLRCLGVTTGYMWGVVNSVPFTEAMINQASGANYPAVTDKVVHAYEIPIPPIDAQDDYERLVKQSDKSK